MTRQLTWLSPILLCQSNSKMTLIPSKHGDWGDWDMEFNKGKCQVIRVTRSRSPMYAVWRDRQRLKERSFCPPPFRRKAEGHCFRLSVVRGAWFRIFNRYLVPSTPPTVFGQSFWNFTGAFAMVWRIACVFFQNPEIIFYYFFRIFNLDIFWALILQKYIGSRYLVPSTPPTVLGQSFWNFTRALRMVWKYACGFFRILKLFFITFFAFLT